MEKTRALIRKITKGDFKQGLSYAIGQKMKTPAGDIEVVDIIIDSQWQETYGKIRYNVYVEIDNMIRIWKSFPEHDVTLEYDLSIETYGN
jgi:hypothetical protein